MPIWRIQRFAGLADLEVLTHAEDVGGRPKTYGNLGRLTLGLKEGLGITRWPHNLGGSGLT